MTVVHNSLKHWFPIIALLLLFWWTVLHAMQMLPAFEGTDEASHFGYVTDLRLTGQLPNPDNSANQLALQESGQAPLPYLIAWVWSVLGCGLSLGR